MIASNFSPSEVTAQTFAPTRSLGKVSSPSSRSSSGEELWSPGDGCDGLSISPLEGAEKSMGICSCDGSVTIGVGALPSKL